MGLIHRAIPVVLCVALAGCQAVAETQGREATIRWLQSQGMDRGSAIVLADNKPALRQYIMNKSMAGQDDSYCRSLGAAPGTSTYVQCRTSLSANRPVYAPQKQHLNCTSSVVFGQLKTSCE